MIYFFNHCILPYHYRILSISILYISLFSFYNTTLVECFRTSYNVDKQKTGSWPKVSNKKIQKTIVMIMLGIMILSTIMIGISTWV
ncbi:hypothetical protein FH5_01083 [Priestia endophytica]|nr:hypothetical protein FH5_01083 [Priestia endophytica]